jgi:hypothetical protein
VIHVDEVPSVNELYETILSRQPLPLPGLEDGLIEKAWIRANRIHDYLLDRADRLEDDCLLCEKKKARGSQTRYVYETPWEDGETEKHFCGEECADIYLYEEPWAYFECGKCDRTISQQNRQNGWHIQYRDYDGQMVCLKCYEELIIENGVERERLEKGQIPGMFFSYGNTEPLEAGYSEVEGFRNFFVRSTQSADTFRKKALELMDEGKRVVIGYERMAIGGDEGYVTLMTKEPEKPKKRRRHAL